MEVHPSPSVALSLIASSHNTRDLPHDRKPSRKIGPWIFGPTLGAGMSLTVILGVHESTGEKSAIKIVNKNHLDSSVLSPHEIDSTGIPYGIQREIIIMKLLDNRNVLKLYDVYESRNHLYLVTEYVANGELFEYLVNYGALPESVAVRIFYELVNGVFFLHNWGIVHRDLKLENILIDADMHLKIADFGMATLELVRYADTEDSGTSKIPTFLLETSCGSPHYAAPEVISSTPYNGLKSDMWSCGVIFYALVSGKLPFDDENVRKLLLKVKKGTFEMPLGLSPEAEELLNGLLCVDPEKRYDAEAVLKSNLFKKYNVGFFSLDKLQHDYYAGINVFTNSINQDLVRTNRHGHVIINGINFNKTIGSDPLRVDKRVLNFLRILCHNKKEEESIIANLTNSKVNIDKVFYSLLISFDQSPSAYITSGHRVHRDSEEESYPAKLKKLNMNKTYSSVSIIAHNSKRNVSFSHKKRYVTTNKSGSLYNGGSIYKYSKTSLKASQKMRSNRSILSRNSIVMMRQSGSMVLCTGLLNLSQFLRAGKDEDDEDENEDDEEEEEDDFSEEEVEFDDEAINVVSPGVPLRFSSIHDLAESYEKLDLEKSPKKELKLPSSKAASQNFDFTANLEKQLALEREIERSLNYSYKQSPKRNKRYKTTVPASGSKASRLASPTKKRHEKLASALLRRLMKLTLSSKVILNYTRVNTRTSTYLASTYLDAMANQTKSDFERLCDSFFLRTEKGYLEIFGGGTTHHASQRSVSTPQKRSSKMLKATEKARAVSTPQRTVRNVLSKASIITPEEHLGPSSRLDPGLGMIAEKDLVKEPGLATAALVSKRGSRRNTGGTTLRTTPTSFQSLKDSDMFSSSNDIFEPVEFPSQNTDHSEDRLHLTNPRSRKPSKLQDVYYEGETTEDVERDFVFVSPEVAKGTPKMQKLSPKMRNVTPKLGVSEHFAVPPSPIGAESLLQNSMIGDSTKDLIRRTIVCEHGYKDYYKHSVPEFTDPATLPFAETKRSLTERVAHEERSARNLRRISSSELHAALAEAAAALSHKTSKVLVYVDSENRHDSLCNLITNGAPSSSRNLAVVFNEDGTKSVVPDNRLSTEKPVRNSSLLRRLSLNGKKKGVATLEPNLGVIKEASDTKLEVKKAPQQSAASKSKSVAPQETSKDYRINSNKNKELCLSLSRTEALVAMKSLLLNWKKFGIRDVKLKDNVISGGIKNNSSKVFFKKIVHTTSFKIFVYEEGGRFVGKKRVISGAGGSRLEFAKVRGSTVVFDKFLEEVKRALDGEGVLV